MGDVMLRVMSRYASVVKFPLTGENALRLFDVNKLHASVLAMYPPRDTASNDPSPVLFRTEMAEIDDNQYGFLLMNSDTPPNFENLTVPLVNGKDRSTFKDAVFDCAPFKMTTKYSVGDEVKVTVRAVTQVRGTDPSRPVERIRKGESKTYATTVSRPVREDILDSWVTSQFANRGLELSPISDSSILSAGARELKRTDKHKHGRSFWYRNLVVAGTVVDADAFNQAVQTGFGRGKTFGFGLMLVSKQE